jgi:hypothetical protein
MEQFSVTFCFNCAGVLRRNVIARADIITATFTDPVLFGNDANNPSVGKLTFTDNTGTAVLAGIGTNSLSWGSGPDLGIPAAEQFSQLTFTGNSGIDPTSSIPQTIGTISFLNGTSDLDSLIFGATINFFDNGGFLGSDDVIITTTSNQFSGIGLTLPQLQTDADYINICGDSSNICNSALVS